MGRLCKTCTHPERQTIDARLLAGDRKEDVSATFGISRASVYRHAGSCLRVSLLTDLRASDQVGTTDIVGALAEVLTDLQAVRVAAVMAGRSSEVVRAATATTAVATALIDRLGIEDTTVAESLADATALAHAVGDVARSRPDLAQPLADALRGRGQEEAAAALLAVAQAAQTAAQPAPQEVRP